MNANSHQSSASRSGVCGAIATPSAPVVPVQNTLLSRRTIETFAPAHRRAGVEARDEDERVVRAVLDGDAEVRDLDDRRADAALASSRRELGNRLAFLDRGPDQAGRRAGRARPSGRARATQCGRPRRRGGARCRRRPASLSNRGLQLQQRRHQTAAGAIGAAHCRDVREVARVERQERAAAGSHTPWPSPKLVNAR